MGDGENLADFLRTLGGLLAPASVGRPAKPDGHADEANEAIGRGPPAPQVGAIVQAIEAGELRASLPSNDGCWLIQPGDLVTHVQLFGSDVLDGPSESAEVRHARDRAEIEEELRELAEIEA